MRPDSGHGGNAMQKRPCRKAMQKVLGGWHPNTAVGFAPLEESPRPSGAPAETSHLYSLKPTSTSPRATVVYSTRSLGASGTA